MNMRKILTCKLHQIHISRSAGFGLGYSCTEAAQCSPFGASFCPGPNAPPGTRVCTCHPYAQLDEARQLCVPRRGLGAQCTVTADCATQTPDAVCDSSVQLCVCRPNYVPTEEGAGCAPGVTAACQTDDECAPENAECASDGRCACRPGFVHVGEQCLTEGMYRMSVEIYVVNMLLICIETLAYASGYNK